jgi:replicative DNA helicase
MKTDIASISDWETIAEEMRFIGSAMEFIGPIGKQPEKLFRLLNSGVSSEWFTHEYYQSLFEAIQFYAPEVGQVGTIIKPAAIIQRAEQLYGEPGWANRLIQDCSEATYDFKLDDFINDEIPIWKTKLKKPKVMALMGQLAKILQKSPSAENAEEAEHVLFKVQDTWNNDNLPLAGENEDIFDCVRNTVLMPKPEGQLVSSGLEVIDYILGGGFGGPGSLEEGKLITLMGRPGSGKTQLALNLAMRVAICNNKVGFWELEMQTKQLVLRMMAAYDHELCRKNGIHLKDKLTYDMLRNHRLTGEVRERYVNTDYSAVEKNVKMFYDSSLGIKKLCNQMRLFVRRFPETRLLVLDHMGLMEGGNDFSGLGEISRNLKLTATELGTDILMLTQMNRGVESREDKMPNISDARGSGRIEEDSDVILGVMRPYYYDFQEDPTLLKIGVLKNRQGPVGHFDAAIDLDCCAIHDRASHATPNSPPQITGGYEDE